MVIKISVIVHPNSRNIRIEKDLVGSLHVYVKEPAMEGKANKAVTEAVARHYGIKKGEVMLINGFKSKKKELKLRL